MNRHEQYWADLEKSRTQHDVHLPRGSLALAGCFAGVVSLGAVVVALILALAMMGSGP